MTVLAKREVSVSALSWRVLVTIDLLSYLVFAIGGRIMHSSGGPGDWLSNTPRIITPFLVGWFAAALLFGAYPRSGGIGLRRFALNSVMAVLVGNAIGFALRATVFGDGVDWVFVLAAVGLTTLVLVGLRLLYFWVTTLRSKESG
ncbi:MAG: DUF3054 domain-containing protein [Caldilineaceae bacterium SB0668_bin_21]|nr:DUF3054 domain-containing protein [Caldilineaceae bacterium SB0668_bin_21]MYC22493.1 DUF3054 domain-containing protein [Caldilineaceae bacterium SB0662_bin_25]